MWLREQVQRFSLQEYQFEFNKWHRTERLNHPLFPDPHPRRWSHDPSSTSVSVSKHLEPNHANLWRHGVTRLNLGQRRRWRIEMKEWGMGNLRNGEREAVAIAIAVSSLYNFKLPIFSYLSNSCSCSPQNHYVEETLLPQCSSPNNTLFLWWSNGFFREYFANTLSVRCLESNELGS